ncbi:MULTISPECIES: molybdenum cofactor guanylyltransferase [Acidobacteriaceae]|uniref:molybdenum cofactor guanylyltransferase n=1 Tax=Acidobacteriaceae TaxID=204434 RepID=UPI00131BC64B|nr:MULTISPECIES: molybdenum cofactor guanylyltransferase [Acidobacteriaceae]MDW5266779.1 molybdenum cofactor guanylyltransferase [Edaphobacter sp.]
MRTAPTDLSGYVLAGGKSSRMGRDKALLELAGKPLVLRAVQKLRRVCAEVSILGNREELEAYAPLVRDLHEGCGPLGGIEAALAHSTRAWNLLMAVDMPFLPVGFLDAWIGSVIERQHTRVALFTVDGRPQPALCLVHKEVAPFVNGAIQRGEFKLFPVLMDAAMQLAGRFGVELNETLLNFPWSGDLEAVEGGLNGWVPTEAQRGAAHLWFANLNTPEEFGAAESFAGVLAAD